MVDCVKIDEVTVVSNEAYFQLLHAHHGFVVDARVGHKCVEGNGARRHFVYDLGEHIVDSFRGGHGLHALQTQIHIVLARHVDDVDALSVRVARGSVGVHGCICGRIKTSTRAAVLGFPANFSWKGWPSTRSMRSLLVMVMAVTWKMLPNGAFITAFSCLLISLAISVEVYVPETV